MKPTRQVIWLTVISIAGLIAFFPLHHFYPNSAVVSLLGNVAAGFVGAVITMVITSKELQDEINTWREERIEAKRGFEGLQVDIAKNTKMFRKFIEDDLEKLQERWDARDRELIDEWEKRDLERWKAKERDFMEKWQTSSISPTPDPTVDEDE